MKRTMTVKHYWDDLNSIIETVSYDGRACDCIGAASDGRFRLFFADAQPVLVDATDLIEVEIAEL